MNDSFVGAFAFGFLNLIPPAVLPGGAWRVHRQFRDWRSSRSTADVFTKVTNSTTYHLQDEVLLPWYLHTTPSFSVNGQYTFQNISVVIPLVVNSPASISGSYTNTAKLSFAPVHTSVTSDVVYLGRGCPAGSVSPGSPADPYLADPRGKIALIDRGVCGVNLKIDAAARAGAIRVLIGPGSAG